MQTLLSARTDGQPKQRTFRNYLSAIAAIAAGAVWIYQWLVFPAANIRKDLQLVGSVLLLVSLLAGARRRKTTGVS